MSRTNHRRVDAVLLLGTGDRRIRIELDVPRDSESTFKVEKGATFPSPVGPIRLTDIKKICGETYITRNNGPVHHRAMVVYGDYEEIV